MLVNIKQLVEPMSRGVLVDDSSPDYPPLVDAIDGAHDQGGLVLWCHNADGMEAPVAAILGKLDGINLFDPWWLDPDYEIWYRLLNCGLRLPASTGSDWYLCSSNRVYADVGGTFSYETWLDALRAGRTFITNGPILRLTVDGHAPSNDLLDLSDASADRRGRRRVGGHPAGRPRRDRPRRRGRLHRAQRRRGARRPRPARPGRRRCRLGRRALLGQSPHQLRPPALGAHQPGLPPRHCPASRPSARQPAPSWSTSTRRGSTSPPAPASTTRPSATACSSSTPTAAPPSSASPAADPDPHPISAATGCARCYQGQVSNDMPASPNLNLPASLN